MNALCSLVLVLGLMGRAFAAFYSLGSTDGNEAMRSVWGGHSPASCFSSSRVIAPGGDKCCFDWFTNRGECGMTLGALKKESSEFTVYITFQDDAEYTLYYAALADLKRGGAAKNQIKYFARRVVVGAMNRMLFLHNNNPSTFTDCDPFAADIQAKTSFVQLFYDNAALALKMEFKVSIPMYWVAATTVSVCTGPQSAYDYRYIGSSPIGLTSWNPKSHTVDPGMIMWAMSDRVFFSGTTGEKYALKRDLNARQAIVDEATQLKGMSGPVVSQLVKALNPRTPTKRDVVSYLRGLLLKSGKAAKVIAMGVTGTAKTKKGG